MTSVYLAGTDAAGAMAAALIVVLGATIACLPAVRLLPRAPRLEGAPHAA